MVRNSPINRRDPLGLTNDPGDFDWPSYPADGPDTPLDVGSFQEMLAAAIANVQNLNLTGDAFESVKQEVQKLIGDDLAQDISGTCTVGTRTRNVDLDAWKQLGRRLFEGGILDTAFWVVGWAEIHYHGQALVTVSKTNKCCCKLSAIVRVDCSLNDTFDFKPAWGRGPVYNGAALAIGPMLYGQLGAGSPSVHSEWNDLFYIEREKCPDR